jgi:hypothetical protein
MQQRHRRKSWADRSTIQILSSVKKQREGEPLILGVDIRHRILR